MNLGRIAKGTKGVKRASKAAKATKRAAKAIKSAEKASKAGRKVIVGTRVLKKTAETESVLAKSGEALKRSKRARRAINKGASNAGEKNYVLFNKTHAGSAPVPKGTGPNGGRLQSHHGLQQQWAKENLSKYGYDPELAPTVTIETGKGMPHTSISNAQNARRNARVASENGKWSSSLQDELQYTANDFKNAGFSKDTIKGVMDQQYKMLDKLGVPYERIVIK